MADCAVGLDCGTSSVRALVVDLAGGREIASATWNCARGTDGVETGSEARPHRKAVSTSALHTSPPRMTRPS